MNFDQKAHEPYQAPAIEREITTEELSRESLYAGTFVGSQPPPPPPPPPS